jgi:hypothetical protein
MDFANLTIFCDLLFVVWWIHETKKKGDILLF